MKKRKRYKKGELKNNSKMLKIKSRGSYSRRKEVPKRSKAIKKPSAQSTCEGLLSKGKKSLRNDDHEGAIDLLTQAASAEPKNFEAKEILQWLDDNIDEADNREAVGLGEK